MYGITRRSFLESTATGFVAGSIVSGIILSSERAGADTSSQQFRGTLKKSMCASILFSTNVECNERSPYASSLKNDINKTLISFDSAFSRVFITRLFIISLSFQPLLFQYHRLIISSKLTCQNY